MIKLTVSNSGTAWIRDMAAQGKSAAGGWASSPNAAYYASLDLVQPQAGASPALPESMTELLKLRTESANAADPEAAEKIRRQLRTLATENAIPASGNIINVQA